MSIHIVDHPLIAHKLTLLRDKATPTSMYRQITREIARLIAFPLFQDLVVEARPVTTPLETMNAPQLAGLDPCIISILRAGNGFLDGLIDVVPTAKIGFVGMERDAVTHVAREYYCKLPKNIGERPIFVVDPMLATGGSAVDSIALIKKQGGKNISFLGLVAAPEGIEALQKAHPEVRIVVAAVDRQLNATKYILPGLGDAGDRYYGTMG